MRTPELQPPPFRNLREIIRRALEIAMRKLNQRQAAQILGLDQANISRLMNGKLSGFTLDRLFRFSNFLGMDVEVTVKKRSEGEGEGMLMVRAVA